MIDHVSADLEEAKQPPGLRADTSSAHPRQAHKPAEHTKPHKPQRAQTLMRRSVAKPFKASGSQFHVQAVSSFVVAGAASSLTVAPKLSVMRIHPGRLQHSKHVPKSQAIQHYAPADSSVASQPVWIAPADPETTEKPSNKVHHPAAKSAHPFTRSQAVFERALAHATAHEQPAFNPKKHAREQRRHARRSKRAAQPLYRRSSTLVASSLVLIILTGLLALQYRPALTLHFASAKAGFQASLPAFRPSGFSYGAFNYAPGLVAIQFKDSANRSFSLQQQRYAPSDQTSLSSLVADSSHSYQTVQIAGHTIYLYGQNNASWVAKGILYNLNGNGSLSTNDVLNIASSI